MRKLIDWLARRPRLEDDAPDIPGFEITVEFEDNEWMFLDDDEDDDFDDEPDEEPDDGAEDRAKVEPVFTAIDYENATGEHTRRRITMRKFAPGAGDSVLLYAYCHERRALRAFRCDRITAFIDPATGELFEPADFWRDLGLDPNQAVAGLRDQAKVANILTSQMTCLAAMAECDGYTHPDETETIVCYVVDELERDGVMRSEEEVERIKRRLWRLRPTQAETRRELRTLFGRGKNALKGADRDRFIRAMTAVANADGVLTSEEFDFLVDLDEGRF